MQRAAGRASLTVAPARGATRLADLAQSGSARIMLPRTFGDRPEAVFLNTSGGLTSGDVLSYGMALAPGAALTGTTQTAERAYLAPFGPARLTITATLGDGARLDWLPQETILFQGAHLCRETTIDLAGDATLLMVEIVVLGRRAMGETVSSAHLSDRRRITRQGRPQWCEAMEITPEALAAPSLAVLGGAWAVATLALLTQGAESAAASLQALPPEPGVTSAASGWNGRTLLRATAPDLWPLKRHLARAIVQLTGRPLPRVWQMQGVTA